jgi:glucan-binding YG repeat protein
MKVYLTLATDKTIHIEVADEDALYRLLNREGEYATGWLEYRGDWINLAAVVQVRPIGG